MFGYGLLGTIVVIALVVLVGGLYNTQALGAVRIASSGIPLLPTLPHKPNSESALGPFARNSNVRSVTDTLPRIS